MQRQEWILIANALRDRRQKVMQSFPPRGGGFTNAEDWHDRKLIYLAKLEAVDELARDICRVLKGRSSRFDGERFLRIVSAPRKSE